MVFTCLQNQSPSRTRLPIRARARNERFPSLHTGHLHLLFPQLTVRTGRLLKRRLATVEETFIFDKLLKRGGFSELWHVRFRNKPKLDPVVIKLMPKKICPTYLIVNEMAALRILNSWSFVVQLDTCFQTPTHYAIVMKFATRGTLNDRVKMVRCFSELVTRFYAAGIAEGLFTLHVRGIVHRDLNLDNILICENGHVVLSDFGWCYISDSQWNERETSITPWAEASSVPHLPAPEMYLGMPYDKTVDWWSFGVILYRMVCGEYPFALPKQKTRSGSMSDVTEVYRSEVYPNYMSLPAQQIISQLLARRPTNRLGAGRFEENAVTGAPFFYHVDWTELSDDTLPAPFSDLIHPSFHRVSHSQQGSSQLAVSYMGTLANPKMAAVSLFGERMSSVPSPTRSYFHLQRASGDGFRKSGPPASSLTNFLSRAIPRLTS